jgi:SpoVK/Ycf46/Vps4 family AAA+-type ATPase
MPNTRNLAQLFRALAEKDVDGAAAIAALICSNEEKKGHRSAARTLRGALHAINSGDASNTRGLSPIEPTIRSTLPTSALVRLPAEVQLGDVVLSPAARAEIESVILEWSRRESLHQRGLTPRSKLLFHGPPGCGKSLTAQALATELGLPVYVVRFDAIISSFLGQTAIQLRQLFVFAETNPCVLLFDELDALGKRRGNPLEVGELDRIVISLLQELEHSRPMGIIIGTSNLAENLDDALWRRFELALEFRAPTKTALTTFAKRVATEKHITLPAAVLRRASSTGSFAEAKTQVIAEARRQILRAS